MISDNTVFLPGTLTDNRLWLNQVSLFPNHEIINLRRQDTLEGMLNDVASCVFDKFHLIGFSMGGYIAQEFALKHPQRVLSLTIIASSALGYPPNEKEVVLKTIPLIKPGVFKGITEKRLKDYLAPQAYTNLELKSLIKSMSGEDAAEVYLRQLKATLDRRNLTKELSTLDLPITFIAGRDDNIVTYQMMEQTHQEISGSKLYTIEECGHFVPLEKPQELNQCLIESLSSLQQ